MKRLGISLTNLMLKWSVLHELLLILMAFQQISWVFPKFEQFDMGLSFGFFLSKQWHGYLYQKHFRNGFIGDITENLHYWTEVTTRFFLLPGLENGMSNGMIAGNLTKWRFLRKMFNSVFKVKKFWETTFEIQIGINHW